MTELELALVGDSAAAPPAHIIEGLEDAAAREQVTGAPHTIYQELWHAAFWQHLPLQWIEGIEAPFPVHNSDTFPPAAAAEPWPSLCSRFLEEAETAAGIARVPDRLDHIVGCTDKPGLPLRRKSVRDLLEGIATHNQYHLGRIVLLRQLEGRWPPPSGGNTW